MLFNSCSPRSAKASPEPPARSFTVHDGADVLHPYLDVGRSETRSEWPVADDLVGDVDVADGT
jgi:hypothetical protein